LLLHQKPSHQEALCLFPRLSGNAEPHFEIPWYIKLHTTGKLKLTDLITHEFKLEKINEALDAIRSDETGRVMIAMDHGRKILTD
jgi:Zn-dependent alcohol dehydrogenase